MNQEFTLHTVKIYSSNSYPN